MKQSGPTSTPVNSINKPVVNTQPSQYFKFYVIKNFFVFYWGLYDFLTGFWLHVLFPIISISVLVTCIYLDFLLILVFMFNTARVYVIYLVIVVFIC